MGPSGGARLARTCRADPGRDGLRLRGLVQAGVLLQLMASAQARNGRYSCPEVVPSSLVRTFPR